MLFHSEFGEIYQVLFTEPFFFRNFQCIKLSENNNNAKKCCEDVGYILYLVHLSDVCFGTEKKSSNILMVGGHIIWQSEGLDAFSQFHLYICLVFLIWWSHKLHLMDSQVHRRFHEI
jgi:hypothetical protein